MLEPGTVMDVDGSAGRGGRLPAEIQSGAAAQPAGLREPGDFCGAELSSPSSGRAAPSRLTVTAPDADDDGLAAGCARLSEPAFQKIWDNPLDADYDRRSE